MRLKWVGIVAITVHLLGAIDRPQAAEAATGALADYVSRPLPLIEPGTKFTDGPPADWSHLISFVRGQLTRGDVEKVTDTVRYYAEIFNLVMLADAQPGPEGDFVLRRVGIGFSMRIGDTNVVVDSETQKQLGGNLSFIGRGVLSGNYDSLDKVRQIARTAQTMLIDAPAIMLQGQQHVNMVVRYLVWVHPTSGKIGTAVWLLNPDDATSRLQLVEPTLQVLPPSMFEDRVMHVDGNEFNFLGVPTPKAFALVRVPPGKPFAMSDEMQSLAATDRYSSESYGKFIHGFTRSLSSPSP
ncbi:MAG: pyruvate kinase [Planctomycetota bacterium]